MVFGVDESFVIEARCCEVDEKSTVETGGFEIVEHLGGFDIGQNLDRLQFYDDRPMRDEIGAVGRAQETPLVENGNRMLPGIRNPTVMKFKFQGVLIDRL